MTEGEKQGVLDVIDVLIEGYKEGNPVIVKEAVIKDLEILRRLIK